MAVALRTHWRFLATNALGVVSFLAIASRLWIEPELANEPGANTGFAFVWIVYAAPIAAAFVLGDLIWLLIRFQKSSSWPARAIHTTFTFVVLACWVAAYLVDNAHHGI